MNIHCVSLDAMPNALETLVGNLTLADLAARTNRTVEDLVAFAFAGAPADRRERPPKNGVASRPARSNGVDTRTVAGREAYQAAVLEAIAKAGDWTSAAEVRSQVGGTPIQFRAAVNRLIEDGRVRFTGKARATRYASA